MFDVVWKMFSVEARNAELQKQIEKLRAKQPAPVIWLFGKTQTGKTSIIRFLTGAEEAEIGAGFQPCTRFSRIYPFPVAEAPLLTFLDTRGIDEPSYDPAEDLRQFDALAHVVVVTVRALDHAQENVIRHLRVIRKTRPSRPIVLVATCLHEAYPQLQHAEPYFYDQPPDAWPSPLEPLKASLNEQRRRFDGLHDAFVPVDLTKPEEGYEIADYGGDRLKRALLESLPEAYRQTLLHLGQAMADMQDLYARHALPHIVAYSSLAASAGAIPIPLVDLLLVPAIQTRMIYHLAQYYGQPLTGARFLELASTLGFGMLIRQASREIAKVIPYVGSVASSLFAGSSTLALGKAFCFYYSAVHQGHVPRPDELRRYYHEQLALAEKHWFTTSAPTPPAEKAP